MKLSPEQEKAVCHVNGPILIFAGAGSGKTRVISNRIAHLIESVGVPAGKIVALSFTNKSAREMEERVRKMIPKQKLKGIVLSTFHSLGLNILKKHIGLLGYKQPFLLMNQNDQEGFLTTLLIANKIETEKNENFRNPRKDLSDQKLGLFLQGIFGFVAFGIRSDRQSDLRRLSSRA